MELVRLCFKTPSGHLSGGNKQKHRKLPGYRTSSIEVQTRDLSNKKQECQPFCRNICILYCYATPSSVVMFSKSTIEPFPQSVQLRSHLIICFLRSDLILFSHLLLIFTAPFSLLLLEPDLSAHFLYPFMRYTCPDHLMLLH
jgi:hypothetical protein